jgi:hypothetical protein
MKQLLQHERLRRSCDSPKAEEVNLYETVFAVAQRFTPQAKGLTLQIQIAPHSAVVRSNCELIGSYCKTSSTMPSGTVLKRRCELIASNSLFRSPGTPQPVDPVWPQHR